MCMCVCLIVLARACRWLRANLFFAVVMNLSWCHIRLYFSVCVRARFDGKKVIEEYYITSIHVHRTVSNEIYPA